MECPESTQQTLPEHISPKKKILKAEPHMFILMLEPLRRQRIFPETWIRLLRVGVGVNPIAGVAWTIKPCGVSAKGQTV